MLDRQTCPLEIARKVLKLETINDVRSGGYTPLGYSILDRWALNSPDELRMLEAKGSLAFDLKLYGQQQTEAQALSSETARQASLRGMSDWEILESMGIDMSLKITK
ncbi:hypothetical protein [Desulfovibrio sp. ZJ200]|uniref:hypothetical protein n=1 Tax=Desulfovibrio sp. ZJ200 TaxID=2709792 RepID=UPI001F14EAB2|nr:hypothetical protein [Desulfovibrio sp. ZJ200]